jgi:HSP20 family molecular chaperone IbpA
MALEVAGEPQFTNMVRQMGKMMDQLQKGYFNFCPAETWTPPVNLYENEIGYIVCVDLSGVDKEKIELVWPGAEAAAAGRAGDAGRRRARAKGLRTDEIDYGHLPKYAQ